MASAGQQLISVDDHVVEPADLWQKRLPARWLDDGPRVVDLDGDHDQPPQYSSQQRHEPPTDPDTDDAPLFGPASTTSYATGVAVARQAWLFHGGLFPVVGLSAVTGRSPARDATNPIRFDQLLPGFHEVDARVEAMDTDGVWASLNYPTFCGLAGDRFLDVADRELALACVQAWNDFIVEEWCAAAPGRMIPQAILPLWDPRVAVQEIHRVAVAGCRAVSLPDDAHALGLPGFRSSHWDPVWAALVDTDVVANIHIGSSHTGPFLRSDLHSPSAVYAPDPGARTLLHDLCSSEVFRNFPDLRVSLAAAGQRWVQRSLQRMDDLWERHRGLGDVDPDDRPSDLFREHVWVSFIDDGSGIDPRELVDAERLLWASDYPLLHSSWPYSRARFADATSRWEMSDRRLIAEDNARDLYRWPG